MVFEFFRILVYVLLCSRISFVEMRRKEYFSVFWAVNGEFR
jgi:hypothetical protein